MTTPRMSRVTNSRWKSFRKDRFLRLFVDPLVSAPYNFAPSTHPGAKERGNWRGGGTRLSDDRPSFRALEAHEQTAQERGRPSPQSRTLRWSIASAFATASIAVIAVALLAEAQVRSSFLGAAVGFIAGSYAAVIGLFLSAEEAGTALAHLYRGEFGKLLITGSLSAAAFGFIEDLHAGVFVLALVATLVASTLGAVVEQMTASDRRLPFTGK